MANEMTSADTAPRAASILAERERWVANGVATPKAVTVAAHGARIETADGRELIDFAGGIGCLNVGHGNEQVLAAIHEQVDSYLHQCFMVASYEPYVELCRRLGELSPCRGEQQKSVLFNSGSEAVENAVKIARAATGRPAVIAFERGFHGRTLLTMTMTSKLVYKRSFGPYAPEVHHLPAPYPYRGIETADALEALHYLFKAHVDPGSVACVVLEPVQGEGGFIPMPADFLRALREICDQHGIVYVDDEVQSGVGRTGKVWAVAHLDVEPDLLVSGKSLGGGLPLAAVTGRAELMDAVSPGGLGGTFGGNPLACVAGNAVLDIVASESFAAQAQALATRLRESLDQLAAEHPRIGEVRGLGTMLAMEMVEDPESRKPDAAFTQATLAAAFDRGLLLLACGLDGNVVRLLPPVTIGDADLEEGLGLLGEALLAAVER
jgi:4-aminobutyrate aminotransferase